MSDSVFGYESPYQRDPEMEKQSLTEPLNTDSEDDLRDNPLAESVLKWPPCVKYPVFAATPTSKPKTLVKNLLDCGSRILFGGGSKTFKTWLQCDLAICLACGAPWLGFECVPSRVLYVNLELREYYIQRRLASIIEAKELDCALDNLTVLNLRGHAFDRPNFCAHLLEIIEQDKTQVIFVDPFYKILTAKEDENNQTQMGEVLRAFDPINKCDVTTSFGVHFSKGNQAGKDPEDRISGAGTIVRDADDVITLTKHETDHAFTLDFIVRDYSPIEPFVIQWQSPIMIRTDLDPAKIKKPLGRSTVFSLQPVVDLITDHDDQLTTKELEAKALEDLGMSRSTFYVKLSQIKKQKLARLSKLTNKWTF